MSRFDQFLERAMSMARRNGLTTTLSGQTLTMTKQGVGYKLNVSPAKMPCDVNMSSGASEPTTVKWVSLEAACRRMKELGEP